MTDPLAAFTGPLIWGVTDCCRAPCAARLALTGHDAWLAADFGNLAPRGAVAQARAVGGWAALLRAGLRRAGLRPGVPAAPGVLAIYEPVPPMRRAQLAVCLAPQCWIVRAPGGFMMLAAAPGEAWG